MIVELDGVQHTVGFGEIDGAGQPYITVNRRRHYYVNKGNLYNPIFVFKNQEAV